MNIFSRPGGRISALALAVTLTAHIAQVSAQVPTPIAVNRQAATFSLKQSFEAAWSRQPEARAAESRHDAAGARRDFAANWLAEPPSLELAYKTDQLNRDQGSREYEAGLAMPLWLPGERAGQRNLAEAEGAALDSRLEAARLRMAGEVREAWWSLALARIDLEAAEGRHKNAQHLSVDVARRVISGDLSRADGHQAEAAEAGVAYSQTVSLGVRIPIGSGSRNRVRLATAAADATEAEARLAVEQERVLAGIDAARLRDEAARNRLAAAERRARLTGESRGFFEKSFRLGETDLPTRLRIELEAAEAQREAARARVEQAASVSALRQALGLLPE